MIVSTVFLQTGYHVEHVADQPLGRHEVRVSARMKNPFLLPHTQWLWILLQGSKKVNQKCIVLPQHSSHMTYTMS